MPRPSRFPKGQAEKPARTAACCRTDTACSAAALNSSLAWSRAAARERTGLGVLTAAATAPSSPHQPVRCGYWLRAPSLLLSLLWGFRSPPAPRSLKDDGLTLNLTPRIPPLPRTQTHPEAYLTSLRTFNSNLTDMSRPRTNTSWASHCFLCSLCHDGNPTSLVPQDKTFLHPQLLPFSHTPRLTHHQMLLALLRGTSSSDTFQHLSATPRSKPRPLSPASPPCLLAALPPPPSMLCSRCSSQ